MPSELVEILACENTFHDSHTMTESNISQTAILVIRLFDSLSSLYFYMCVLLDCVFLPTM